MSSAPSADPILAKLLGLPQPTFHSIIAAVLSTAIAANDELPTKGVITRFHAKVPSKLGIVDYLTRLVVYTPYPRDAILLSLVYVNRISRLPLSTPLPPKPPSPPEGTEDPRSETPQQALTPIDPGSISLTPLFPGLETRDSAPPAPSIASPPHASAQPSNPRSTGCTPPTSEPTPIPILNSFTLHRLLLACLLVGSKFSSDGYIPQPRAAKVGGVSTRELVRLEVEVLKCLGWELEWELNEVEDVARALYAAAKEAGILPQSAGSSPSRVAKPRTTDGAEGGREPEPDQAGPSFKACGSPTATPTKSTFEGELLSERPPSPALRPLTPTPPTSPSPSTASTASSRSSSHVSELEEEEAAEEQEWKDLLNGKIARKPSLNRKLAHQSGAGEQGRRRERMESGETVKLREGVRSLNLNFGADRGKVGF